jgi:N4-gp56 family major capsid protein
MPITNTMSSIGQRTNGFAVASLLKRGQARMILERFGQIDPQGQNKTLTRRYRRIEALPPAVAPIAEGISPAGQQLTVTDLNCVLEQYADFIPFTDVIQDTIEDNTLDDMVKVAAQQVAETKEIIRFSVLKAGTNVFYAGTATTRATTNGTVSRGDLRRIYRSLKRNRAEEISEVISATAKIATEPVGRAYFAVSHTDLDSDWKNATGFVPVEKYSDAMRAMPGEIGKIENVRVITSDLFSPWLAAATGVSASQTTYLSSGAASAGYPDVYPVLIFGQNSYAIVPLQGKNAVKINVINPTPSVADPCGQKGFVSWKMYDGCVILNELWMARYEVAATANPS